MSKEELAELLLAAFKDQGGNGGPYVSASRDESPKVCAGSFMIELDGGFDMADIAGFVLPHPKS